MCHPCQTSRVLPSAGARVRAPTPDLRRPRLQAARRRCFHVVACAARANAHVAVRCAVWADVDQIMPSLVAAGRCHFYFSACSFAVQQRNLPLLAETLAAVSNPASPRYGQYLTRAEVQAAHTDFEAAAAVERFVAPFINGCESGNATVTSTGDFVTVHLSAQAAERMLSTQVRDRLHSVAAGTFSLIVILRGPVPLVPIGAFGPHHSSRVYLLAARRDCVDCGLRVGRHALSARAPAPNLRVCVHRFDIDVSALLIDKNLTY